MSNETSLLNRALVWIKESGKVVRRAFREFLAFPSLIIGLFLLLAVLSYIFERSQYEFSSPILSFLKSHIFANAQSTSDLLGNIAASIITVTSITITLLLLIVQQSASNLTTQVFDQFLRRPSNQFYFGYFVGVAVYTLITLATVDEPFNPVFSASLSFLFVVIAMFMLLVLFYSTIHQMRPAVILAAIHDHTLSAREHQQALVDRTRRRSEMPDPYKTLDVISESHGFVTNIDLDMLSGEIKAAEQPCEIVYVVSIGHFVAYHDKIAEVHFQRVEGADELAQVALRAVSLDRSRDLATDPEFGIRQLETIAWAATSPSKSNLIPGILTIHNLRNLLAHWISDGRQVDEDQVIPVVYNDSVMGALIHAFESLVVVASLTKEHQIFTDVLYTFATMFSRLPDAWQSELEDTIFRLLQTFDSFFLTAELDRAFSSLIEELRRVDRLESADRLQKALIRKRREVYSLAEMGKEEDESDEKDPHRAGANPSGTG